MLIYYFHFLAQQDKMIGTLVSKWGLAGGTSHLRLLNSRTICPAAQLYQLHAHYSPNSQCRDVQYKPIRSVLVANRGIKLD